MTMSATNGLFQGVQYENVIVDHGGNVATVTFDRKGSLNAFNQATILELTDVARRFQDDLTTQAVVLSGAPNAFSAGIDLNDPATWEELDDVAAWEEMPQITVTAMEGMAVGAGCAIALACDWRVLASDAYLYVPEVKIGLNLQWGALPRLVTLVGPSKTKQITLLCDKMDPNMALDWGLIDRIADPGQTVAVATEMASRAASMPPATTRMVKEAVNATANALHRATSFADADQSALTRNYQAAVEARQSFNR
jgi:enoyl-CoA hydratase